MRKKALRIEEREIQVINWFGIRIQHDNEDYATMPEIARGIGMSPSSRVLMILNGLVEKESLESIQLNRTGRFPHRGYRLKNGTFQRPPKQTRTIPVKSSRGLEQMELL